MEFINKNVEQDTLYSGFHGYHDHDGQSLNMPVRNSADYMMGVELETKFPSDSDRDDWCDECESNWFYMEADCSLPRGGCEFITTPLAPADAKNPKTWAPLITALAREGVISYQRSECGCHIHISCTAFGQTAKEQSDAKARLIYLYYYVLDPGVRQLVFNRPSTHYATDLESSITPKTEAVSKLKVALKYKEVRDEVQQELCDMTHRNRYYSINIRNAKTVEFRQGKGSLNATRIAAICEFVEACALYARKHKDIAKYTQEDFLSTLREDGLVKTFCLTKEK